MKEFSEQRETHYNFLIIQPGEGSRGAEMKLLIYLGVGGYKNPWGEAGSQKMSKSAG